MEISDKTTTVCVQTSDWCWGVGHNLAEAIKVARNVGSKVTKTGKTVNYIVFEFDDSVVHESVRVDQMGTCRWEVHTPDQTKRQQGLVQQWVREDGKERILTD